MGIINKDNFLQIRSFSNKNDPDHVEVITFTNQGIHRNNLKLCLWGNKQYWYIEFLSGNAFYWHPISKLVDSETFQKIKQGKITLLLCNFHEAYHSIIDELYKYIVIEDDIPAENILLLTNSFDIDKEIDYVSLKYNRGRIKAICGLEFLFIAKDAISNKSFSFATNTLIEKDYEKKYICLNGFPRPHRTALVNLLNIHNLLNLGYVSYNTRVSLPPDNSYFFHLNALFNADTKLMKDINDNINKVLSLETIWLDTNAETARNMGSYLDSVKEYYMNTYFSVVTETLCIPKGGHSLEGFTGAGRSLSEKTYKPIINQHPFILLTIPNSLEILKAIGFKTFHPYINESYDKESNDSERIYMVFEETRRLCNLNSSELKEFLNFCRPIVKYNYEHLLNIKDFCYPLN